MIYNFLYFIGVRTLVVLQKRSANALNVFNQVAIDLKNVNNKIDKEHESKLKEIEELLKHKEQLIAQGAKNAKLIAKVEEFFS